MTIDPVTYAQLIDDCASVRDIPLQVSVSAALLESDWLAGDTMDTAAQLNDALLPFVPTDQRRNAMIAALDIFAGRRARLATVLTAAAMRLGQSEWLNELTEMEDART